METRAEAPTAPPDRLDSWKEIASYLRRDVRTLQRWEKDEGLPVHRLLHGKQGTVYAYRAEIDAWWQSRRRDLERATRHGRRRWPLAGALGAIVVLAVAAGIVRMGPARVDETSPVVFQFSVPLADEGAARMRVSPDGRELAFSTCCTDRRIWRHSLTTNTTSPVPGTQGAIDPFWSPDGQRLAFFGDGKLKMIDPGGGPPVTICDAPGAIWGGTWNADETILFSAGLQLYRVAASGGTPTLIPITDPAGTNARRKQPQFLPDGKHFIYHVEDFREPGTYLASLDAPTGRRLIESAYPAMFAPPSHLAYIRGTALYVQRIDLASGRFEDNPTMVAPEVAPSSLLTSPLVAASNTSVLAFMSAGGGRRARLAWFARDGNTGTPLPDVAGRELLNPAISPDGSTVAGNRMDPQTGNWDIWIVNVTSGKTSRLTFDPGFDTDPVWSPAGTEIVYSTTRDGRLGLYRKVVDGSKADEPLVHLDDASLLVPTDWSPDGRFVVFDALRAGGPSAVWALPLSGEPTPVRLHASELPTYGGQVSPDGRWVVYASFESGINEVFVQRFMHPGPRTQVSSGGGAHPRWSAGGRELVYWTPPRGLASAALRITAEGVRVSPARPFVQGTIPMLLDSRTHYDLAPDGRALVRQVVGMQPPSLTVISNWRALVER